MRKNALAMSIATLVGGLGFVGAASADVIINGTDPVGATKIGATTATQLQVNNGGVGHTLILPYFSTQNGNATIYSIVNTDTINGKVVKVRHRGASNSDDILDFTVLMSPGDVWTATLTAPTATSVSRLVTADKSCTLPAIPAAGQDFITVRLTAKDTANGVNANTREGYVEIFNMADIQPGSALFTTTKHVNGVPACNTATIEGAILNTNHTTEATAAAAGLAGPTTGLFGGWTLINVPQTTTYSGEMAAVRALTPGGVDGRGNFVVFPQDGKPYFAGNADLVSADPLLRSTAFAVKNPDGTTGAAIPGPVLTPLNFDLPDMSTPYTMTGAISAASPLTQAGILTASLAVKTITNEFATDPSISGQDDWDVSMPTRRYSVAMDYANSPSRALYSVVSDPVALPAGQQFFHVGNTSVNPLNSQQLCVTSTSQTFFNREEGTAAGGGAVFSPGVGAAKAAFCGETSVLSFRNPPPAPSALGGAIARQDTDASGFINGWAVFNVVGSNGLGLPILSANFFKATNPGVSAGFSGTFGISTNARFTR